MGGVTDGAAGRVLRPGRPRPRLGRGAGRRAVGRGGDRSARRWSGGDIVVQPDADHDRGHRAGRPGRPAAGAAVGGAAGRHRRDGRPDRARRGRVHRAVARLPVAEGAGRGVPPARRAVLGRSGRGDARGDLDDRRLGRAAGRRGARRRRPAGSAIDVRRGRVRGHPGDARRGARRWASTRTAGSSPAATTTRWWRRSRPATPLPEDWRSIGRVLDGAGVTVDGACRRPGPPAGITSADRADQPLGPRTAWQAAGRPS